MARTQRDFTQGPIAKSMIAFSLPFLLSNILQALYGAVDMLVVGNFSDPDPVISAQILSGVNIGSQITNLVVMMVSARSQNQRQQIPLKDKVVKGFL